ncbi:MAG: acyltransferase [Fischerella sp.]|nr:acyltransferase [Fischerella sp.]
MNYQSRKKTLFSWFPYRESIVISLVGSIPLKLGVFLRRLLYRYIFARLGNSVTIQTGAEFIHAFAIELGNDVKIYRDVCLDCGAPNSRIFIGDRTWLERGVDIQVLENGYVEIGESSFIGPYVCMAGPGHIRIGKQCLIASHSTIYANNHNFADPTTAIALQEISSKGIVIEDDCWIGSGARILDGVTIGRGSVIGAGAVVTKDIPPYSVAIGVPARVSRSRKANIPLLSAHSQENMGSDCN